MMTDDELAAALRTAQSDALDQPGHTFGDSRDAMFRVIVEHLRTLSVELEPEQARAWRWLCGSADLHSIVHLVAVARPRGAQHLYRVTVDEGAYVALVKSTGPEAATALVESHLLDNGRTPTTIHAVPYTNPDVEIVDATQHVADAVVWIKEGVRD